LALADLGQPAVATTRDGRTSGAKRPLDRLGRLFGPSEGRIDDLDRCLVRHRQRGRILCDGQPPANELGLAQPER
jgi:hypothetical protein